MSTIETSPTTSSEPSSSSPWLWPGLGGGVAAFTVLVAYLIIRFAPSPFGTVAIALTVLLIGLAVVGYLGTKRGHAATFVAIALVLPYLLGAVSTYASAQRAASELGSFFEDTTSDVDGGFEGGGDGTYGSDPALDALQDECVAGDVEACDELYMESPSGSEYESTAEDLGGGF